MTIKEYKEEKYFYTRLINWLDKNEPNQGNTQCGGVWKPLKEMARREWDFAHDQLKQELKKRKFRRQTAGCHQ